MSAEEKAGRTSTLRLLLDENISRQVAQALRERGYDVVHVFELGLQGSADPVVFRIGQVRQAAVCTANRADFELLAGAWATWAWAVITDCSSLVAASFCARRIGSRCWSTSLPSPPRSMTAWSTSEHHTFHPWRRISLGHRLPRVFPY